MFVTITQISQDYFYLNFPMFTIKIIFNEKKYYIQLLL